MAGHFVASPSVTGDQTNLGGLDELPEPEMSFAVPNADADLLRKGGSRGAMNLKTPRGANRDPLVSLTNERQRRPAGRTEFTPLMKSATKNNMSKKIRERRRSGLPDTPGMKLPDIDESQMPSEHNSSSIAHNDNTPMPQHLSSSVASTPLAQLPARDGANALNDGNVMTLREQENIIDKIEKENFGLKMKIHYLEVALSKRGNEFNQAALKENTDLKVNRITMQRELHKFKKTVAQAERDAELYRKQLDEYREKVRRKQIDETVRAEVASLKTEIEAKDDEIKHIRNTYESSRSSNHSELEKLRDEIEDLKAELRDKDRDIDQREDEIDALKANANQESNNSADLEDELGSARQQIEDLEADLEKAKQQTLEARNEREDAEIEKRQAVNDLDELRDEMANKSFTTKGLSRQLEEKAAKFEDDYHELQERFQDLQRQLDGKVQSERQLQERLRAVEKEGSSDMRHVQQELEVAEQQRDSFERKLNNMSKQLETATEDLQKELNVKTDEKDLLQTRHDALTTESAQLQTDLRQARDKLSGLEARLEQEKQMAVQNDIRLRSQHKDEADGLMNQIDSLERQIASNEEDRAATYDEWQAEKRRLEATKDKAEERANGLQRTVDKLNDVQGTLSGREMNLQEALQSEQQRHEQEEKVLNRQIQELNQDLASKRAAMDDNRIELSNAKEELRISVREQALLKEKITELEDEIEVLQADIEQEHQIAQQVQQKSFHASDSQTAKLRSEKAELQTLSADLKLELENVKRALQTAEFDRDQLEAKLEAVQNKPNDTFDVQQEKREIRRETQRLEKELEKVRIERDTLEQNNKDLEEELEVEIERGTNEENRLNKEISELRNKQFSSHDEKDRELSAARNKASRLEARIRDLEDILESRSQKIGSPSNDASGLRRDLEEVRKNEAAATKRESDLKSSNRDLKMKINDLERDLHEARLAQLKAQSPSSSGSASSREVNALRQQIFDARAELKTLNDENLRLKHSAKRSTEDNTQFDVLQTQLDSKNAVVIDLEHQVRSKEQQIEVLRREVGRIRREREEARQLTGELQNGQAQMRDLRAHLEPNGDRSISLQHSARDQETAALKAQLQRLRNDKTRAAKQNAAIEQELNVVQARYERMLERLTSSDGVSGDNKAVRDTREKEIRGLMKEIMWLKAKCRREERLRQDLAWSKSYLENGEAMRAQCNQIDLRILREMGATVDGRKYQKKLRPIQKFRAGVFTVIAAIRMSNMQEQWAKVKKLGHELSSARRQSHYQQNSKVKMRSV